MSDQSAKAAQDEIIVLLAKNKALELENKALDSQTRSVSNELATAKTTLQALQKKTADAPAPATETSFIPTAGVNFMQALQEQAIVASELQPTDTTTQVANKTFKVLKIPLLSASQWMAASADVVRNPFAYPKIMADGQPELAASFIVGGLRAEFGLVSTELCSDLCNVIMGLAPIIADYVRTGKTPQMQMELLMPTLYSCQRKIEMLQERRTNRKPRGGGGGGKGGKGGGGARHRNYSNNSYNNNYKREYEGAREEEVKEEDQGGRGSAPRRGRGGGRPRGRGR